MPIYDLKGATVMGKFEPLPVGWYLATIVETKEKTSSTGSPVLSVRCQVLAPEPFAGQSRNVFLNVSLDTLEGQPTKLKHPGFLLALLQAIVPEFDHNEEDFAAEWEELHGLILGVEIESHREYNNKTYENTGELAVHDDDRVPQMESTTPDLDDPLNDQ